MKKLHWIPLTVVAALIGTAFLNRGVAQDKAPEPTTKPAAPAAAPAATAVCDVVAIFKNYDRATDLTKKLKARLDEIKAESDNRGKEIDKIQMTLEELKPGSKEYEAQLDKYTKLSIDRQAWLNFQDELAKRENYRFTKDMYAEVLAAIEKVARENGYQLVLFKEASNQTSANLDELLQQMSRRKVLYSDPSLDITEAVLKRLNTDYAAKK